MATRRLFPDTSALFPMSVFDLIMRLAQVGIHDLLWSEELLEELRVTWDRERQEGKRVPSPGGAAAALAGVRQTFPSGEVLRERYESSVADMPGTAPHDRPHVAAAKAGGATHIVTNDAGGGFPTHAIAAMGISVQSADQYLADVAQEFPEDVFHIVHAMVTRRRNDAPDITFESLVDRWESMGMIALAQALS